MRTIFHVKITYPIGRDVAVFSNKLKVLEYVKSMGGEHKIFFDISNDNWIVNKKFNYCNINTYFRDSSDKLIIRISKDLNPSSIFKLVEITKFDINIIKK